VVLVVDRRLRCSSVDMPHEAIAPEARSTMERIVAERLTERRT
jgi:hypothetical protein